MFTFLKVYCLISLVHCVLANDVWPGLENGHLKWNTGKFARDFLLEPNNGHYIQIGEDRFIYRTHLFQTKWMLYRKSDAKMKSEWFSDEQIQHKLDKYRMNLLADSALPAFVHGKPHGGAGAQVLGERIIVVAPYPLLVSDRNGLIHMKWTSLRREEDFVFGDGSYIQFGRDSNLLQYKVLGSNAAWIGRNDESFGIIYMQHKFASIFSSDAKENWYTPRWGENQVLFVYAGNANNHQQKEEIRVVVKPLADVLAANIDGNDDLYYDYDDSHGQDEELEELLNQAFIAGYKKGFHHGRHGML